MDDLNSSAEWEIWYRDLFDRDCPAKVEVRGYDLAKGLVQLWARHLFEGLDGLSRFTLLWKQENRWIDIVGDTKGARLLRTWTFGAKETADRGYLAEADASLLEIIAISHARLIAGNKTSELILGLAATAADRQNFERQLPTLTSQ
jgi:hypothetical protein